MSMNMTIKQESVGTYNRRSIFIAACASRCLLTSTPEKKTSNAGSKHSIMCDHPHPKYKLHRVCSLIARQIFHCGTAGL